MSLLSIMAALNVLREDPSPFLCKQALTWSSQELPKVRAVTVPVALAGKEELRRENQGEREVYFKELARAVWGLASLKSVGQAGSWKLTEELMPPSGDGVAPPGNRNVHSSALS